MKKNIAICLLIALLIGGWVYGLVRYESQSRDAYIYGIPEGARFSYTDIPMFAGITSFPNRRTYGSRMMLKTSSSSAGIATSCLVIVATGSNSIPM